MATHPVLSLWRGAGFGMSYSWFGTHVPLVTVGKVDLPDAMSVSLLQTHKLCVTNLSTSRTGVDFIFADRWSMSMAHNYN